MLALTKVKKEIEFNQDFRSLIEVLKSMAVAQFHVLEKKLWLYQEFDQVLDEFFQSLDLKTLQHRFLVSGTGDSPGVVVAVTSDQGLLGGLNLRVVTTAMGFLQTAPGEIDFEGKASEATPIGEENAAGGINLQIVNKAAHSMRSERDELVVVGERGQIYARERRIPFTSFPGIQDEKQEEQVKTLQHYLFKRLMEGHSGALRIVHPQSLSLVNQRIEEIPILPYSKPLKEGKPSLAGDLSEMLLESSRGKMLEYLTFVLIGHKLKQVFSLSRIAELGARYLHLEESSQRIQEMNQKLKLRYFRLRHEIIDQSIRELFSARSLYAG